MVELVYTYDSKSYGASLEGSSPSPGTMHKILVIVGPTASGKTSLSIELAKRYNGEVISADSRQVYKGLDIGTGKVTKEEMDGVPHYLIDVADPKNTYTVSDFVKDTDTAIEDIVSRGKLPIIVGGTFLYVDTLLGKITTPEVPPNESLRNKLERLSLEELQDRLKKLDAERYAEIDIENPRRLIRAIEVAEALGKVPKPEPKGRYDALTIGIDIEKEELHKNIHNRLLARIEEGLIEEVRQLHENGLSYERMDELGLEYRYIAKYLEGELSKEEMLETLETKIRQYAKRQMTWLKRSKEIVWIKNEEVERIEGLVEDTLRRSSGF